MSLQEGYSKGDICNRNGCLSEISEYDKDGSCSCHINPPCGYCTEPNSYCDSCGWDAKEEQDEYYNNEMLSHKENQEYYAKINKERSDANELFYKKYRGEIEAQELNLRYESHTHFTMKVKGVFPKGTQTYESLRPLVKGTFGGRFTTIIDENSYKFEYISYTD